MTSADQASNGEITPAELLERVRAVSEERRRRGSLAPAPQNFSSDPAPGAESAVQFSGSDVYPWRSPTASATTERVPPIAFNDLLDLDGERFVSRLYHALLLRDPSPGELQRWARRLAAGLPRPLAVIALRLSRGGRATGRPLPVRWNQLARQLAGPPIWRLLSWWRLR